MCDNILRLVESLVPIASAEISRVVGRPPSPWMADDCYKQFLELCNGGYTRDGFFHFFGGCGPVRHNVIEWNETGLWKNCFGLDDSFFVFAEDIFGNQYGFVRSRRVGLIKMLSPETGQLTIAPDTFDGFVEYSVFSDSRAQLKALANTFFATTGGPWQEFMHISYDVPPCLGGDPMDLKNWDYVDSIVNLRMAGQILTQVKNLKPGTKIRRVEVDPATQTVRLIV
jgi:hypothetical protein